MESILNTLLAKEKKSLQQPFNSTGQKNVFLATTVTTPVGSMIAIANEQAVYFLDFLDHPKLKKRILRLQEQLSIIIQEGMNAPLESIQKELEAYFAKKLTIFKTPLVLIGSPFQQATWNALKTIPYGTTISYKQLATTLSKPTAFRAVANANGANNIAIIVPCHRVIATDGKLGGYGSGVDRKQLLLAHEQEY